VYRVLWASRGRESAGAVFSVALAEGWFFFTTEGTEDTEEEQVWW
jgi:hypothetical protein